MRKGIEDAIAKAGSQAALANGIGVTPQFITKALKQGWLPLDKAKIAATMYGVPLVDMVRSDIADAMRQSAAQN